MILNSKRDMHTRNNCTRPFQMSHLIVKKDVRLENRQDIRLLPSAEEERIVHAQTPRLQRAYRTGVRRSVARSNQSDEQMPSIVYVRSRLLVLEILYPVYGREQVLHRAGR